ncbi:hypothetical protein FRC11_001866 [Ceratobasidium sp. 423]|nr:hypothetical protein FRC11_001866 [Ceratobasidium sp. 423]
MNRPRQSRKSSSTPPPAHPIWSHPPATMSNPSLGQHPRHPLGHPRSQQPRHHSALYPRRPTEYPSYSPNHASSSTALSSEGAGASSTPKGALKVFSSVKRSFSMSATKKSPPSSFPTMSTAEETAAAQIRLSDSEPSRPPPTVQQIAAGLVSNISDRPPTSYIIPTPSTSSALITQKVHNQQHFHFFLHLPGFHESNEHSDREHNHGCNECRQFTSPIQPQGRLVWPVGSYRAHNHRFAQGRQVSRRITKFGIEPFAVVDFFVPRCRSGTLF